jgi:hypothetical protein
VADFVIVVATLAKLASAMVPDPSTAALEQMPTPGFKTYSNIEECEDAVARNVARPETRLVCVPVGVPTAGHGAH